MSGTEIATGELMEKNPKGTNPCGHNELPCYGSILSCKAVCHGCHKLVKVGDCVMDDEMEGTLHCPHCKMVILYT